MRTSLASTALALAGVVIAVPQKVVEDSLYSSRLARRGLDADGNFNICMQ